MFDLLQKERKYIYMDFQAIMAARCHRVLHGYLTARGSTVWDLGSDV